MMTQTLLVLVLFVGAIALLPWAVRRLQQRHGAGNPAAGAVIKVMSAVAVGPHQKVVTVEVGPEHARTCLILGVTQQNISCLHVLPFQADASTSAVPIRPSSFQNEMAVVSERTGSEP